MIEWKFYIDDVEYEEPNSFADLILGLKRDEAYHGVFFEASVGTLEFSGLAAEYIMGKEDAEGIQANIIFRAEIRCDENALFEELISGKLNMSKLDRECGKNCSVKVPIEQSNCTMLFRNRFDQKVDLDSLTAFDKITALEAYQYAGFTIAVPAKALEVGAVGSVVPEGDTVVINDYVQGGVVFVRASYGNKTNESIRTTQLEPSVQIAALTAFETGVVSPIVLLEEDIDCFDGLFHYEGRLVGALQFASVQHLRILIVKGTPSDIAQPMPTEIIPGEEKLGMEVLQSFPFNFGDGVEYATTYDVSFTGDTALENGQGLWIYFVLLKPLSDDAADFISFDPETFITITASMLCPQTEGTTVYMINEALSRTVEAVSDGCLKVKSDLYGRADSRPYASEEDGCGSLRIINSGLQLRNAIDAKIFISPKDCFEGLNPIDNIGFGIEPDPARPGFDVLRVEDVRYFYRDEEVLQLPFAPSVKITIIESEHYANIKVGYQKWEVQAVNGLDEVNANREFRTSLTSVTNTLTIQSKFVGGSYAAELTRQQSYATTGAADTTYDNETFIFCVSRLLYGFEIEQGVLINAANIFSPSTLFNWRIRPFYNLMRWFKTIAAGYANVGDTEKKLFFTAGAANYTASGEQSDDFCKLETGAKAENHDLGRDDFLDDEYLPIWRPKAITLKYPLSVGEYKLLKSKPYGYISVQCGTGEWLQGYIISVQYSPTKGEADFTLKMRWLA